MKNNFFHLPVAKRLALIRLAGDRLDVSDMIIEKDFWVCWLLEKLFALPIKMAFKGGTSLSKVFGLIKRFSEDIDITVDYLNFKQKLDLTCTSRAQLKKIGDQLKKQLKTYVTGTILPYFQQQIAEMDMAKSFAVTVSDDGEQLRFYYPSITSEQLDYLRDHVLLEFGVRNSTEPCEKHIITPYLTQVVDHDISLPKPMIDTLSPLRTFWEKATLIHVECHRANLTRTPERLSRHWYDLFMLYNSRVGEQALSRIDILQDVLEHKKAFFNASYANYDNCLNGKFRLTPIEQHQTSLVQDFKRMIVAGMFYGDLPPAFDNILESLKSLEKAINEK
jgi:hypothetical protein